MNNVKKNAIKFFDHVEQVCKTDRQALEFRDSVVSACGVTKFTWYSWRRRKHIGSDRSRARIAELLATPEVDFFELEKQTV